MKTELQVFHGGDKMVKCTFCGKEEYAFKGVHLLKNDGTIAYFCSSKCRLNALKLKRDKRKIRWTGAFRENRDKSKGKKSATKDRVIAGEHFVEEKK